MHVKKGGHAQHTMNKEQGGGAHREAVCGHPTLRGRAAASWKRAHRAVSLKREQNLVSAGFFWWPCIVWLRKSTSCGRRSERCALPTEHLYTGEREQGCGFVVRCPGQPRGCRAGRAVGWCCLSQRLVVRLSSRSGHFSQTQLTQLRLKRALSRY